MIDFSKIPDRWPLCTGFDCPRRESCLHYMAFTQIPSGVTRWTCVLPQALKDQECRYFQKNQKEILAHGFHRIIEAIKSRDARHDIRIALTDYFGSKGTYYRYKDGERLLTLEQQQWIKALLQRHGITGLPFDSYVIEYDFKHVSH